MCILDIYKIDLKYQKNPWQNIKIKVNSFDSLNSIFYTNIQY